MQQLDQIFSFITEIEKLKAILRKTRPVGLARYENSAEHSWHVCLCAWMLREYSNVPVNIEHVIKLLLVHDLGEIDAGDTLVYVSDQTATMAAENASIQRISHLLPPALAEQVLALWQEFSDGKTAESLYARSIDRIPPLLHNLNDDGHSWKAHQISADKVFEVNRHIALGSQSIWNYLEAKLQKAKIEGILPSA